MANGLMWVELQLQLWLQFLRNQSFLHQILTLKSRRQKKARTMKHVCDNMTSSTRHCRFASTSSHNCLDLQVWCSCVHLSWLHKSLTCDEPLDRTDMHGAQRPKILSSLFFMLMSRSSTSNSYVMRCHLLPVNPFISVFGSLRGTEEPARITSLG